MIASAYLLAVIALAFAARVVGLGSQSFWWDEAYSAVVARRSIGDIIATVAAEDFHPPLHYVVLKAWALAAGESEFALRYSSVIFGTLTVAAAAYVARRWFGKHAGLLAATLTGASPYLWYYATEARMFALAGFIGIAIVALADRAAAKRGWKLWILWALASCIGLYTYYYLAPVVAGAALFVAVRRRTLGRLGTALGLVGLSIAPWATVLEQRVSAWTNPWTEPTTPARVVRWTWPAIWTGLSDANLWDSNRVALALYAIPLSIALVLALTSATARGRQVLWRLTIGHAVWAAPLAMMAAIAIIRPVYHPRYAFPVAPLLFVAIAGTLVTGGRATILPRALLIGAMATLFGFGAARYHDGAGLGRDDYRSAIRAIDAAERPGDAIVTNSPPGVVYYHRGRAPWLELPTEPYRESEIAAGLASIGTGAARIWYQTHDLRPSDPEQFLLAHLEAAGDLVSFQEFGLLKVRGYALLLGKTFQPFPRQPLGGVRFGASATALGWAASPRAAPSGGTAYALVEYAVDNVGLEFGSWAQLVDREGRRWGRADHQPRDSHYRRSPLWQIGDRVEIGHAIPITPGTPPGTYRVETALYRLDDVTALEVVTADGRPLGQSLVLGEIQIERQRAPILTAEAREVAIGPELALREVRLPSGPIGAGGSLSVELLWRATGPLSRMTGSIALLDERGRPAASVDLTLGGVFTSELWRVGDLVRDQVAVTIPPTLPDGNYTVAIRVSGPDGVIAPSVHLGTARVEGIARSFDPPPMANPLPATFGDGISLAGYTLERAGDGIALTLVWRPTDTPRNRYKVFAHILAPDGTIAGQHDAEPANWERPTTGWVSGEYVVDRHTIAAAAGAPIAQVRIGVYDAATGQRRVTATGADHILISLPNPPG